MRLPLALLFALFCLPVFAQEAEKDEPAVASSDDPDAAETAPSKVPLDEIRRYVAVFNAVKDAYVEPVDDKKLMHSAIRGLLLDLDPHSTYFDKEDADAFDEQSTGAYDGVGVELLQQPDNSLRVIAPIDDTPAAKAGIKAGDVIVAIDGKPISGEDGMEPLRGEPGTKLTLTLVREGKPKPFDVTLTRETIRVASVRSRMLEPGYGYIRISAFQADTGADFQRNLDKLQASGKLRGLVLDLRSNPGGLLTSAVQVADDLLDKGNIVTTRGRIAISDARFDATPGDRLQGAPLVVLVDAGSASAAEVLAGALARQQPRARGRQPHLRQGLGADRAAAGQRRFGQAHHRALLHAQWQIDPGQWHRARRGSASRSAEGRGACGRHRLQRGHLARPPAWRRRRCRRLQRRRGARRRQADRCGAGGIEEERPSRGFRPPPCRAMTRLNAVWWATETA